MNTREEYIDMVTSLDDILGIRSSEWFLYNERLISLHYDDNHKMIMVRERCGGLGIKCECLWKNTILLDISDIEKIIKKFSDE